MARSNGGITGVANKASFGKCIVTSKTSSGAGGAGGSGVVVIKEPEVLATAPGVWSINDVYDNVKAGTWTN